MPRFCLYFRTISLSLDRECWTSPELGTWISAWITMCELGSYKGCTQIDASSKGTQNQCWLMWLHYFLDVTASFLSPVQLKEWSKDPCHSPNCLLWVCDKGLVPGSKSTTSLSTLWSSTDLLSRQEFLDEGSTVSMYILVQTHYRTADAYRQFPGSLQLHCSYQLG